MSDLINRDSAIEALRYAQHRFTVADEAGGMGTVKWSEDVIYFDAAVNALSFLPSAEPERKKGRWTVTSLFIKCSECGEAFMLMPQNYCPNCGADMRGEEDE